MPRTPRSLVDQQDQMLRGKVSHLEKAARQARLDAKASPNREGITIHDDAAAGRISKDNVTINNQCITEFLDGLKRACATGTNPDGPLRPYSPENHTDPSDFIPSLSPPTRPLGIPDALAELDTQLSIAADQINDLYSRLAPIFYPTPPSDGAQCTQSDPYADSSTFAMAIANKAAIVHSLNSQLTDILRRISL